MTLWKHTRICWLFLLLTAMSLAPTTGITQTYYGSVVGTVTDSSGSALVGLTVALTNQGTAERKTLPTNSHGDFQFVNVPPGIYTLDVEGPGFKRFRRDSFQVEVQSVVRIDAAMQIGEVSQVVDVTAQTPLIESDTTSLGQVIEGRAVRADALKWQKRDEPDCAGTGSGPSRSDAG